MEKAQGATEYLLILIAVLIVTGIAISYLSRTGTTKPMISMRGEYDPTDHSLDVYTISGRIPVGEWKWRIINPRGEVYRDWTNGSSDLEPERSPVELVEIEDVMPGVWTIDILHIPTNTKYPSLNVVVSQ